VRRHCAPCSPFGVFSSPPTKERYCAPTPTTLPLFHALHHVPSQACRRPQRHAPHARVDYGARGGLGSLMQPYPTISCDKAARGLPICVGLRKHGSVGVVAAPNLPGRYAARRESTWRLLRLLVHLYVPTSPLPKRACTCTSHSAPLLGVKSLLTHLCPFGALL
jgi:hypothetical protein